MRVASRGSVTKVCRLLLLVALALSGACYRPRFKSCQVRCSASDGCPQGLTCDHGLCAATPGGCGVVVEQPDASSDGSPDSAPDVWSDADAGSGDAPDELPGTMDAPSEHSDAPSEIPDAAAMDAVEASAGETLVDAPNGDGGHSPCVPSPADGPPVNGALAREIVGSWRLCPSPDATADVRWLVGGSGMIRLGPTRWWRIKDAQGPGENEASAGLYFRVLEGSKNVFHFVDSNVAAGAGADLLFRLSSGSGALDVMSCDGAARCFGSINRLVPVTPLPGGG